jgi:hypothetical protein
MRRRIAVYGATDAALALLPALARRADLELAWVYDPGARALRRRLAWIEPGAARLLQQALTDDPRVPARADAVELVIDGGLASPGPAAPPARALSPATAAAHLGLLPEPWREPQAPEATRARPAARAPATAAVAGTAVAATANPSTAAAATGATAIAATSPLERAIAEGRRFALLRCDAGPAGPAAAPPAPELVARVRRRAAESLRGELGPGERLVTARDGSLLALLPLAPGADASARLVRLARRAAEQVAKELGDAPQRTPLVFGYALHPDEALRAEELLARAARSRIRML